MKNDTARFANLRCQPEDPPWEWGAFIAAAMVSLTICACAGLFASKAIANAAATKMQAQEQWQ